MEPPVAVHEVRPHERRAPRGRLDVRVIAEREARLGERGEGEAVPPREDLVVGGGGDASEPRLEEGLDVGPDKLLSLALLTQACSQRATITSVDQLGATLGRWLGVPDSAIPTVLPNIVNFPARYLPLFGP